MFPPLAFWNTSLPWIVPVGTVVANGLGSNRSGFTVGVGVGAKTTFVPLIVTRTGTGFGLLLTTTAKKRAPKLNPPSQTKSWLDDCVFAPGIVPLPTGLVVGSWTNALAWSGVKIKS